MIGHGRPTRFRARNSDRDTLSVPHSLFYRIAPNEEKTAFQCKKCGVDCSMLNFHIDLFRFASQTEKMFIELTRPRNSHYMLVGRCVGISIRRTAKFTAPRIDGAEKNANLAHDEQIFIEFHRMRCNAAKKCNSFRTFSPTFWVGESYEDCATSICSFDCIKNAHSNYAIEKRKQKRDYLLFGGQQRIFNRISLARGMHLGLRTSEARAKTNIFTCIHFRT